MKYTTNNSTRSVIIKITLQTGSPVHREINQRIICQCQDFQERSSSIRDFVCLSVCLSVFLSFCLSVCLPPSIFNAQLPSLTNNFQAQIRYFFGFCRAKYSLQKFLMRSYVLSDNFQAQMRYFFGDFAGLNILYKTF